MANDVPNVPQNVPPPTMVSATPEDAAQAPAPAATAPQPSPSPDDSSTGPSPDTASATSSPTPTGAPQMGATPSPATGIPARALPRGRDTGVHGVLAHIALGALGGLARSLAPAVEKTAQTVGRGISNLAESSAVYQNKLKTQEALKTAALARKETQQRMNEAQVKSLDDHTRSMLADHALSMQVIAEGNAIQQGKIDLSNVEMKQQSDLYSMIQAAADNDALVSQPKALPAHPESAAGGAQPMPQGAATSPTLGADDGAAIGSGKGTPVLTGDPAAPLAVVNTGWAKNTPTDRDFTIFDNWKVDSQGNAVPEQPRTVKSGSVSYFDLIAQERASVDRKNAAIADFQRQEGARQVAEKGALTAAQIKATEAQAYKATEEGKEAGIMAGVGNPALTGADYIASLPPMMQDLVGGGLRYQVDPKELGRGKARQAVVAAIIHSDPNKGTPQQWSLANYNERYNFMKEWGSTTRGAGATRDRINTAVGHLNMLARATPYLAQNNLPALNAIANQMGLQTGSSAKIVYDTIALKAASEAAAAVKGGNASPTDSDIEAQAKQFVASLAPGQQLSLIKAQYGLLETQIETLRGKFQSTLGSTPSQYGQPVLYGNNQQIIDSWLSRNKVPPTKYAVRNANGAIIGYADDARGTNYHPF